MSTAAHCRVASTAPNSHYMVLWCEARLWLVTFTRLVYGMGPAAVRGSNMLSVMLAACRSALSGGCFQATRTTEMLGRVKKIE